MEDLKDFDDAYGYDPELAKGKWFTTRGGIKVKLAFAGDANIEAIVQKKRNDLSDELGRELTSEEHEQIGIDVFVENILLDWKSKLPFNKENIIKVIEKYSRFTNDCMVIFQDNKCFQEKRIEEQVGK